MAPASRMSSANFPLDPEGHTYHVGVKMGRVANRILTVGDPERAHRIAKSLDSKDFVFTSKRGFTTITGAYKGVPVSIVAIGMGTPMADMMVREIRATVEGPIQLIRFGSCGGIGTRSQVGLIAVAKDGAASVTRNNDFFAPMYAGNAPDESLSPYVISEACPADKEISEALVDALRKRIGDDSVITGMNATADSFYSSQGRLDPGFNDYNQDLIEAIRKRHPNCETLEMESFTLLHLARCASFVSKENSIRAAACAMIFADRKANDFIAPETVERLENDAGLAVLDALVACPF